MSALQSVQEGATSDSSRRVRTAPESWEGLGWEYQQQAIEAQRRTRDVASSSSVIADSVPARRGMMGVWMKSLGTLGFMLGSVCAGYLAYQMGYDWWSTSMIAGLVGVAGGAAGVMLPPLLRAIGWTIVAALVAGIGGAALYLLLRIAPAFVDQIVGWIGQTLRASGI